MAQSNNPFRHIRLVVQRGSTLLKIVVLAAVVLCTGALLALRGQILETRAQTEALRSQAITLEQENNALTEDLKDLESVDGVLRIAQEELGLVDPDTIIFKPEH